MRKRSSRRATTYGVAALVSLSLIATACGGSDDDGADDTTGTDTEETTAEETGDTTAPDT